MISECRLRKLSDKEIVYEIENNVFGTKNLLDAALECNTERFVLISTDKAVEPVSVYGVSKKLSEKLVIEASKKAKNTQSFMFVRFGNVLGSRGSILPVFTEQIQNGGPVTVTDPAMERYFMTIPEACSLVLQAGGVGKNGRAYLLDMGEPIKILDLAEQIIKFSGFEPYKEMEIKFIGSRPGERITEPLWLKEENPTLTDYQKILSIKCLEEKNLKIEELLEKLEKICFFRKNEEEHFRNKEELLEILRKSFLSLDDFYNEREQNGLEVSIDKSVKVML